MARSKSKKKAVVKENVPPPVAAADEDDGTMTEDESLHDKNEDVPMDTAEDDKDDDDIATTKQKIDGKNTKKKDKNKLVNKGGIDTTATTIPFMDTFYLLSSEESPTQRAIAARDLINYCFPPSSAKDSEEDDKQVNYKDAAYALTRLLNGLCTGRAASRQGFASCLSSFIRVSYPHLKDVLKEDTTIANNYQSSGSSNEEHPAMVIRKKLLSTTDFLTPSDQDAKGGGGGKKNKFGGAGKMKGMEERDHVFGRLFGILAIVRSGTLSMSDFPKEVIEGYTKDLIDLYHYKKWMREPSAHAIIELLSSLATTNSNVVADIANKIITPSFFLSEKGNFNGLDLSNKEQWLESLTPEQIAVALYLQTPSSQTTMKFQYPLNEPVITVESISTLASALSSTSSVIYPRSHAVWNALWIYLTLEDGTSTRQIRSNEQFSLIIKQIIDIVVVKTLLGNGEGSTSPTNERRSLALQIICALCGSSELNIALPSDLIGSVLTPKVVTGVFLNVLCASGGLGKKKGGGIEHHLKPLTLQALDDLIGHCCKECESVDRRMAFAKAFLLTDPRFDTKTKTLTVSSLLMLENDNTDEMSEEQESKREALWQRYLSFLEEEIVSATSLHNATVYIELMYKLAKRDLTKAPANEARRVVRFFMSCAFFDCSDLSDPSTITSKSKKGSSKKKTKGKAKQTVATSPPPLELSSGLRIKGILKTHDMTSISHPARAIMAARFYSLLSEFISVINSQNRGGNKNRKYDGKGSRPESIYRLLSEINGIFSLLDTSGAKQFPPPVVTLDDGADSDDENPVEASKKAMLRVQHIANDALVKECDGSGDEDILRSKSVFATSCASLLMALHLQLSSCGKPDSTGEEEEQDDDEDDGVVESVHEYISDLADCVETFCDLIEGKPKKNDDEENPFAMLAGLLVNILSSVVGGEDAGKENPIQAAASKLARETVKLSWSSTISVITELNAKNESLQRLVDEDVMSILIESICGEKSMGNEDEEEDGSVDDSDSSEDGLGDSAVFVDATESGMDLDDVKGNSTDDDSSDDESSQESKEKRDEDVELDPTRLESLLLEDSDAEMSDSGMLEHHAGADKALAQLIKLKQEARKESQTERERIDLCNRLRCANLLDSLFSVSVFKSGWLPIEAVLGSIVPILRSRKAIAKSIQSSTSTNTKKSLSEKNALMERLSTLVKDKISKYRCSDGSSSAGELAVKASSDIYEEMKHSINLAHCSCCSLALITTIRCIPDVEDNTEVKDIYVSAIKDWSTRKATKIHACVFEDLILRMPSLASLILVEPLMAAASGAHSPFLKCESIKLMSSIYKNDASNSDNMKANSAMKKDCSKVANALEGALGDSNLQKAKHRDEVLISTKHFVNYVKAQNEVILTESELSSLQQTMKKAGGKCKGGMKNLCSQVLETIASLLKDAQDEEKKPNKRPKAPKSSKKQKKTKK